MQTVEEAYEALALEILNFLGDRPWHSAGSTIRIVEDMTQSTYWRQHAGVLLENEQIPDLSEAAAASRAVIFLRDEMQRTTEHRIWGLSFTLYPTGKFRLEYDYNQPERCENAGETISTREAVARLKAMGIEVEVDAPAQKSDSDDHH